MKWVKDTTPGTTTDTWTVKPWVMFPGGEWQELENTSLVGTLQELGDEGWELIGMPSRENVAIPATNPVGTYLGMQAEWLTLDFILKRPAS